MLIGYARVSTEEQKLDLQREALRDAGCERIFEDTAGGAAERPALSQALAQLRAGDTLVVWRLDRLGRSLKDLIARAEALRTQGCRAAQPEGSDRHGLQHGATGVPHLRRWRSSSGR